MRIFEYLGAVGDGQRGASAAAGGLIVLDEAGDGWPASARRTQAGVVLTDVLPMVSTIPVNMVMVL